MFVMVVMPTEGPVYIVEVVFFCCIFCSCHSFCMPILASRLMGAWLAFSGYRGAPIAAWVSPWSKPYASTDIKKKKKKKTKMDFFPQSTTGLNITLSVVLVTLKAIMLLTYISKLSV